MPCPNQEQREPLSKWVFFFHTLLLIKEIELKGINCYYSFVFVETTTSTNNSTTREWSDGWYVRRRNWRGRASISPSIPV